MNVRRGDVLLVRYPFTSGVGSKVRPALVVQNDLNNQRLTNVIVVPITTTTHRNHQPSQFFIRTASDVGRQSGLLRDSVAACENVTTLEQKLILRKIGELPPEVMTQIGECLKSALGIE